MWDWGGKCWKIKCLDLCSCTDIKFVKWWQQTCWILQNPHVVDTIAAGFIVTIPYKFPNSSIIVLSTLVMRHDRSFIVHLLEPAINQCLYGDLCNLGVQHRYGRFWSSSNISSPTDVMNWLWLFTIVSYESSVGFINVGLLMFTLFIPNSLTMVSI